MTNGSGMGYVPVSNIVPAWTNLPKAVRELKEATVKRGESSPVYFGVHLPGDREAQASQTRDASNPVSGDRNDLDPVPPDSSEKADEVPSPAAT